jgi:GAF domain-containing protein
LRSLKPSVKTNAFYATASTSRRSMLSANVPEEPGIPDTIRAMVPHRAQMFVPIVANGRMLGGIIVAWLTRTPPELDPADVALIESVAARTGAVVENARLFDAYFHQLSEMAALHDLARGVTSELERTAILRALESPLGQGVAVDTMEIYWRAPGYAELQLLFRMVEGTPDLDVPRAVSATAAGLAAVVVREGQPLRTQQSAAECRSRGIAPTADNRTYTHWLGVPVLAGEATLGVLAVAHRHFPFTAAHVEFLGHAAQLVALALLSAALHDEPVRRTHDLNNVLGSILDRTRVLREHITDPRLSEWLGVIEQSVRRKIAPTAAGRVVELTPP